MNKVVGVYETNESAQQAVKILTDAGFPPETLSVYNRDNLVAKYIHLKLEHPFEVTEVSGVVIMSGLVGVLSGLGYFSIPGLQFVHNAGVVRGGLGGTFLGLLISMAVILIPSLIRDQIRAARYESKLNEGKYLVFFDGHSRADIKRAHEVLHTRDLPIELSVR